MFIVNQPTTTPGQMVYFKSQSDSKRYWDFFVENKDVVSPQYVNPLLMAGKGYTYRQLQELDFLDCILPIPLFSGRFVEKNKEMLRDELLFFPCRINICDKVVEFFLGRILNKKNNEQQKENHNAVSADGYRHGSIRTRQWYC